MRRAAVVRFALSLAVAAALAASIPLSGCSEASGKAATQAPCPKNKFDQVLFAVDKAGTVTTIPSEDLERYQRMGYRPASQQQAKELALRECPAGFR
jgi:hypothetical protein